MPGARPAPAASRLFGQRPGAYPVGAGQGEPGRVAAERQQRNLVQPESGPSFPNETEGCTRRKLGSHVARTDVLTARHKRASGISSRYAKARHLPCTLLRRGAYLPTHVREGCPAGRGLVSWAKSTHLSPKVRRFTPHSWSNGRQPPTATCGNARDQPPSQRHAAWKLHCIVRNREGDDEWASIFGSPAAGTPVRRGGALVRRPATAGPPGATPKPIAGCFMTRGCSRVTAAW